MDLLKDTEGTVLFPFQTEIDFFLENFHHRQRPFRQCLGAHRTEAILERESLYFASCGLRGTFCCCGLGCNALAKGLFCVEIRTFGTMGLASKRGSYLGYR
ncbi:hypothetical protein [Enterobacter kobei]|uniref:hypothetical protein n=1 Tax=Enterobacter kobei TaxID=208224 RepID=UPI001FCE5E28|nr:hypothetical protein [Enterobacter kobei]